jgi:hypothetical protein
VIETTVARCRSRSRIAAATVVSTLCCTTKHRNDPQQLFAEGRELLHTPAPASCPSAMVLWQADSLLATLP